MPYYAQCILRIVVTLVTLRLQQSCLQYEITYFASALLHSLRYIMLENYGESQQVC